VALVSFAVLARKYALDALLNARLGYEEWTLARLSSFETRLWTFVRRRQYPWFQIHRQDHPIDLHQILTPQHPPEWSRSEIAADLPTIVLRGLLILVTAVTIRSFLSAISSARWPRLTGVALDADDRHMLQRSDVQSQGTSRAMSGAHEGPSLSVLSMDLKNRLQ